MRYAWIERHRNAYPVGLMCESLGVSKSGWYAARRRTPSQRAEENARLVTRMQSLQRRHRGRYGRRRMHRALRSEVGVINEKRVGRLMRQHGLQSRLRRRFRVVTSMRQTSIARFSPLNEITWRHVWRWQAYLPRLAMPIMRSNNSVKFLNRIKEMEMFSSRSATWKRSADIQLRPRPHISRLCNSRRIVPLRRELSTS